MVDIHCHLLPGVDDGSGNMSDSIEMAEVAFQSGTKSIIATPHCNIPGSFRNYWSEEMDTLLESLQHELKSRHIPINIYKGQEVFLTSGFMELIKQNKLITLNDSRYILVEFDMRENFSMAYSKLDQLVSEGYIPIVAHPERYAFVTEHIESVYKIKELGCLIQINKGSLKGSFGHSARKAASHIIGTYQADFIASDAHSQFSRTPFLADVHEFLCERFSTDYADILLRVNPNRVINDERIYGF